MSKIVDNEFATGEAALAIAQEIMRFLLDNPAAPRAYAANFQEESSAKRLIEASDAGNREAAENDGGVIAAGGGLSDGGGLSVVLAGRAGGWDQPPNRRQNAGLHP